MVSNDISVILNLACIKATGYSLPADGEYPTQWVFRTNYINLVPEMIGKRYGFLKDQPKPTLDYLPPLYRPSTLNDFGLQVKRHLVVTEIQERFGMKSRIACPLEIVYETVNYFEEFTRNIRRAYGTIDLDTCDPTGGTLPWFLEMIRMIMKEEDFDDYQLIGQDYYSTSSLDNRDLQWRIDNYWEKIRPKLMYILWDIESQIYLGDDELGMYIRRFKRVDKKIMKFRKEMKNPTYPIKKTIHERMRDNIDGRMWGKQPWQYTDKLVDNINKNRLNRVEGCSSEYLTQCGQLKKNKKLQTQYIDCYNKLNAIAPDIQSEYVRQRMYIYDRVKKSFIPTRHQITNRLNPDVVRDWLKGGNLDQDTVLRVFTGKRKSSEEVIMNLDLESSYVIARRS